jgi:hypothetical protein
MKAMNQSILPAVILRESTLDCLELLKEFDTLYFIAPAALISSQLASTLSSELRERLIIYGYSGYRTPCYEKEEQDFTHRNSFRDGIFDVFPRDDISFLTFFNVKGCQLQASLRRQIGSEVLELELRQAFMAETFSKKHRNRDRDQLEKKLKYRKLKKISHKQPVLLVFDPSSDHISYIQNSLLKIPKLSVGKHTITKKTSKRQNSSIGGLRIEAYPPWRHRELRPFTSIPRKIEKAKRSIRKQLLTLSPYFNREPGDFIETVPGRIFVSDMKGEVRIPGPPDVLLSNGRLKGFDFEGGELELNIILNQDGSSLIHTVAAFSFEDDDSYGLREILNAGPDQKIIVDYFRSRENSSSLHISIWYHLPPLLEHSRVEFYPFQINLKSTKVEAMEEKTWIEIPVESQPSILKGNQWKFSNESCSIILRPGKSMKFPFPNPEIVSKSAGNEVEFNALGICTDSYRRDLHALSEKTFRLDFELIALERP